MDLTAIIALTISALCLGATIMDYVERRKLQAEMAAKALELRETMRALSETHNSLMQQFSAVNDTLATHEMKLSASKRSVPHFMGTKS